MVGSKRPSIAAFDENLEELGEREDKEIEDEYEEYQEERLYKRQRLSKVDDATEEDSDDEFASVFIISYM
jgi:hypothetical protein